MMTTAEAFQLSSKIWFAWCIVWLLMAAWSKPSKRREFPWQRLEHVIPMVIGFLLIYNHSFAWKFLTGRMVPQNDAVAAAGLLLTGGGLVFAVWARIALGANWSGTVTIKTGHNLIRRGPYRWIRHPIYTGILISFLGTALLQGEVRAFLGLLLVILALYRKAKREEKFLSEEFGEGFAEHAKHTGMFLPRFG
ncbi:MAG: isoprenylcysteine carboxylmethyltransferase family protein [Acidobacteria bacterium]|nr:isoprenylcysteine carboxylmethyltransferase family protein [Acidobacteriota bacterium]MBS1866083.1 isoprenylcysteine carboxylmethyltransferase family protein [Acidobacteriota bacterium]